MAAAEQLSVLRKLVLVRRTLRNWPLVVPDKLGLVRTVTYRTRSGVRVVCRGRSTDVNETVAIFAGIEYPPQLLTLEPGACVFDVGANIGTFSLLVASLNPGIHMRIVAFEPYGPNAALLRRNLAVNGEQRVTAAEIAVSPSDGQARLELNGAFDQGRLGAGGAGATVTARRLSTYSSEHGIERVDLLKMDIEGGEYEVVEREADWLGSHVAELLIEYHHLDSDRSRERLVELLQPYFVPATLHAGSLSGVVHARSRSLEPPGRGASPGRG